MLRQRRSRGCCRTLRLRRRFCRCGFGLRLFGFFRAPLVGFRGFQRVNLLVILVRSGQLLLRVEQLAEPVVRTQLKHLVHPDGVEGADFHADLAAHAHRHVNVEHRRIELLLAHEVRLLVLALLDVDAARRALLFADLARHAAQPRVRVLPVVQQKRKHPRCFRQRQPLLRILHRRQPILLHIAAEEVPRRLD